MCTKMHVSKWAGQHPGTNACFPHGLARIPGDKAEDKVCWLSSPCYVSCVLPSLVEYVLGLNVPVVPFRSSRNCDPFVYCVSLLSIIRIFFSYLGVVLALPLFCVFPPPSLNGLSLYLVSFIFLPWESLRNWLQTCRIVTCRQHPPPLYSFFLLVLPHPRLPIVSPFILLSTFLLHISRKWPYISSFCTITQCCSLLWRWLHSLAVYCEYGKLHEHLIYLSFHILNI